MRRAILLLAAAVLLVGSTVIAFDSGGFFERSRVYATLVVWALVLVAALLSPRPLPRSRAGWMAVAGLAGLTAWSAVSLAWAPLGASALDSVQLLALYLGALLAAVGLLRGRASEAVEPVLALGALVVIGYSLSERLLPGLIELDRTRGSGGRLEQPLTYWNAAGVLAAVGFVLCARLAGDRARPAALRAAAAAASAPLGVGVYLSYSRGAIAAAVVGLIVLLAAAPSRSQLRAAAIALGASVVAAAASAALPGVADLSGTASEQQRDGAIMLAILVVVMAAAALGTAWLAAGERRGRRSGGRLRFAHRLPLVAAGAVALALAGLVAAGLSERGGNTEALTARGPDRLASVSSSRYEYWRVALGAFGREPIQGIGAGGFRVEWLRERSIDEGVVFVHSLPLETAAELGLPGVIGLAAFLVGIALAARRALRRRAGVAAGAIAASAAWLLHASIDWDWQMPAVTLPFIVLAGALLAAGDAEPAPPEANGQVGAVRARSRLKVLPPAPERQPTSV